MGAAWSNLRARLGATGFRGLAGEMGPRGAAEFVQVQRGSCSAGQASPAESRSVGVVWLDLLLFGILLAFTLVGAWRGALESGLRLAGWAGGYAAAFALGGLAGPATAAALGLPAWLGPVAAGTAAFLAVQVAFAVAIAVVRRRREDSELPGGDRVLGAAFGAARGLLLVVLIGWLGLVADAVRSESAFASLPDTHGSRAAQWSGRVIGSGAKAVLGSGDPAARAAVAVAARPRETLEAFRALLAHPRFTALQRDHAFWERFAEGDVEAACARPSYRALAADPSVRRELADLGLVDRAAAAHPIAFARALDEAVREASVRVAALRRDPDVQALLQDPEVLSLVERGDAFGLLTHPRFRSVLNRASAS
jgi:membrane protein required for colicin V production